jgi:hypothetical protein
MLHRKRSVLPLFLATHALLGRKVVELILFFQILLVTLVLAFSFRQSGAELFVQSLQLVVFFDTWSVARQWRPHYVINNAV